MKLTVTEKRILRILLKHEQDGCTFAEFGGLLDITRRAASIACHKLARKGLAEHLGTSSESYCLTVKGVTEARWAEELGDVTR